jgi:hypothetical protein
LKFVFSILKNNKTKLISAILRHINEINKLTRFK